MRAILLTLMISMLGLLAACEKDVPPRSTREFLDQPILLEATMVRCARDRARTKYEVECVNAREAVERLAAAKEEARRQEMDKQSERKRQALRQAQVAATQARMRAAEQQRLREEAEYLQQFDSVAVDGVAASALPPGVIIVEQDQDINNNQSGVVITDRVDELAGNQPGVVIQESGELAGDTPDTGGDANSDLESVREQLKQRQEPT